MRMNEITFESRPPIDAYGEGGFRVGGLRHQGGLALLPERMENWEVTAPAQITPEAVAAFIAAADELDAVMSGGAIPSSIRRFGFTATLSVNYRSPCLAGSTILLKCRLDKVDGRKRFLKGEMTDAATGTLIADGTALFILPRS